MAEIAQPVLHVASQPAIAPVKLPAPPRPLTIAPRAPKARRNLWLIAVVVLVALAGLAALIVRATRTRTGAGNSTRTYLVQPRDWLQSVRITGTVEAAESYVISAPTLAGGQFSSLTITKLVAAGTHVNKGDLLVEFDRQDQLKNALDKEAEYKDFLEQIRKKQAEQDTARAKDDTELKQAEDGLRSAELEVSRNEVVSKIDAEKNLANLEEARARLKQLRETYDLKRKSAQADLRLLEIQRDRARAAMLHSQQNAGSMSIRAPNPGVVVLNTTWKSGQMGEVQEGDQVRSGIPFMQVMNPGAILVRTRANQMDACVLQVGQRVRVRLDAYPDVEFNGRLDRLAAIGAASTMSDKVRGYPVVFSIEGSDPRLMPGLTAAVDVEVERHPNALVIPRDAVIEEGNKAFVFVKNGSGWEKSAITLGLSNAVEVVAASGVQAGDTVLRNPQLAGESQ